jgi:hypothetical protein
VTLRPGPSTPLEGGGVSRSVPEETNSAPTGRESLDESRLKLKRLVRNLRGDLSDEYADVTSSLSVATTLSVAARWRSTSCRQSEKQYSC